MHSVSSPILTSQSLLERARQRDPDAWRRLCEIYAPMVYSWIRRSGIIEQDAPDVVQEVFRIVSTHIDRFRHDRPTDTFRGWLFTITRTEVLGYFRRRSQQAVVGAGGSTALKQLAEIPAESESGESSLDSTTTQRDLLLRVVESIRRDFEPQTWQAFWRSVLEGHEAAEIAGDLNMTTNAVRQARFRVLTRLRETLGETP